jgi:hypothetical protein
LEDSHFDRDAAASGPETAYRHWRSGQPDILALPVIHPSRSFWEILAGKARPQGLGLGAGWAKAFAEDFRSTPLQATLEGEGRGQGPNGRHPLPPMGGAVIGPKRRR